MATITESDLSAEYWCTSEDVQNDYNIEINNEVPDFEGRIKQATRRVQAWYIDASGTPEADVPTDPPALLRDATALMAASLAHQAFSTNITGDNDGDQRHVFLEDAARDTFDDWKSTAELDSGDDTDGSASDEVTGMSGTIAGRNPIDRTDRRY